MSQNRKQWIWVSALIVIFGLFLAFAWKPVLMNKEGGPLVPVYAPQGHLTPQFPKELILDSAAAVSNSFSINYSTSTNQYTASWNSASGAQHWVDQYQSYFSANGWTVKMNPTANAQIRNMVASNDKGYVQVLLIPQGAGSQVTITYFGK